MNRAGLALFAISAGACVAFPAAADEMSKDEKRSSSGAASDCACPLEGVWNAQNLEGWMKCTGPVNINQTLDPVKDKGTIWILDEQCSSIFSEASRKQDEDILMEREKDSCKFRGTVSGQANGVEMVIDVKWPTAAEKFIKGDMYSNPTFPAMSCEYYRPYEITFDDPIPESEYADRKKKMLKKLEAARKKNSK